MITLIYIRRPWSFLPELQDGRMEQSMKNRAGRVVVAILALLMLAAYSYRKVSVSPHSSDYGVEAAPVETAPLPAETASPAEPEPTVEPTPEPTLDPNSPAGRALAKGLPAPPEIDVNSWEFVLVNADHPLGSDFAPPEIVNVSDSQCPVDSRIAEPLMAMAEDTRAQGLSVYLSSGYRSYNEQAANFQRVCQNNGVADGKDAKGFYITMPAGCSEHQSGLCCDITDRYYPTKNSSLENTEMFQYMSANCEKFGFVVRFPKDKEAITGVMYEPFHFRYVGVESATYMKENNLCLEEFLALYTGEEISTGDQ